MHPSLTAKANRVSAGLLKLLFASVFGLASEMSASAEEIWVITDRQHPVRLVPGARLIELDAPGRIKAKLSALLPSDPAQASRIARQRVKRGGPELQQRLAKTYQAVTDAWSLGVTKVPAVIIDRRYVIYGETDVARAVARIDDYRRSTEK